jgi:LacI family transcriptional regulator, sucrose operon repressor
VIHPSLTTIRFNNEGTGIMAANTIIKMTNGEETPLYRALNLSKAKA